MSKFHFLFKKCFTQEFFFFEQVDFILGPWYTVRGAAYGPERDAVTTVELDPKNAAATPEAFLHTN